MILKLNEKIYDIATTLGTSYDIEQSKKSKITKILEKSEDFTIKEMCDLMFFGLKRKDKSIDFNTFLNDVLDSGMSAVDLQKEFSVFILLLASTDKTEDEIRERFNESYKANMEKIDEEYYSNEVVVENEKN